MDRPNTDGGEILKTSRCIHFDFRCLCGWCCSSFFHAVVFHWRELPQVSFLSRKVFVFVATKHVFCRDKSLRVETNLCRGKHTCLSRQQIILVAAPANDSPQHAAIAEYNILVLVYVIFNYAVNVLSCLV